MLIISYTLLIINHYIFGFLKPIYQTQNKKLKFILHFTECSNIIGFFFMSHYLNYFIHNPVDNYFIVALKVLNDS